MDSNKVPPERSTWLERTESHIQPSMHSFYLFPCQFQENSKAICQRMTKTNSYQNSFQKTCPYLFKKMTMGVLIIFPSNSQFIVSCLAGASSVLMGMWLPWEQEDEQDVRMARTAHLPECSCAQSFPGCKSAHRPCFLRSAQWLWFRSSLDRNVIDFWTSLSDSSF